MKYNIFNKYYMNKKEYNTKFKTYKEKYFI